MPTQIAILAELVKKAIDGHPVPVIRDCDSLMNQVEEFMASDQFRTDWEQVLENSINDHPNLPSYEDIEEDGLLDILIWYYSNR